MANKYLNDTGLQYFFNKLKTIFLTSVDYDSTNKKITKTLNGTKSDVVTLSTLKTDMALNNVANGAEVNQNAFSNVKIGSTTVAADAKTDTLELVAGSNVTLTPDATNDKITIEATDTKYTPASATPSMDGTAAVGTSAKYAREDHIHPSDTSRVPTTRKVNGHALSDDVTVTKSDVGLGNVNNTADANKSVASAAVLTSYRLFDGVSFNGSSDVLHFAVCETSSNTIAVNCSNFQYVDGARIAILFTQNHTSGPQYLNVENNGSKQVYWKDTRSLPAIREGTILEYVYYNDIFKIVGSDTTYSEMTQTQATSGTSTTGMLISPNVLSTTIANAVAGVTGISYQVVTSLPATGETGVIYLIAHSHGTGDGYDEYIWLGSAYEKIGNTDVDLSGYLKTTDMVAITTSEIDTLFA